MIKRKRTSAASRERYRAPVTTTDPAGLAAFAESLRPALVSLRALAEEATASPNTREHSRVFLRHGILRRLRELEIRVSAAAPAADSAAPEPPAAE